MLAHKKRNFFLGLATANELGMVSCSVSFFLIILHANELCDEDGTST